MTELFEERMRKQYTSLHKKLSAELGYVHTN